MTLQAKTKEGRFTYADYLSWPEEERWELIEGVAYDMTPAPSTIHQRIFGELFTLFHTAAKGGPCEVFAAPFDVRLTEEDSTDDDALTTVVQPDISVICDPNKLDSAGCLGAPDLVVEILSPSTAYKDQTEKLALFERHGVKEYWIVNPHRGSVLVYCRETGGLYGKAAEYIAPEEIRATVLSDVVIPLAEVFNNLTQVLQTQK